MVGARRGELESERVARLLRESILRGERAPGSRLVERDVAAELKVSRLPVREAIRALSAEGIVVARPRSWAVVRQHGLKDVADYAETRQAMETLAFVLAAERHDERSLAEIADALNRERTLFEKHGEAGRDIPSAESAAVDFHMAVLRAADNELLTEILSSILTRLRLVFGVPVAYGDMLADHEALFDAIVRRDTEALRALVAAHLERSRAAAEQHLVPTRRGH